MYGSPETVSNRIRRLEKASVGGLIAHFRVGDLSVQHNEESLRFFAHQIIPHFRV